ERSPAQARGSRLRLRGQALRPAQAADPLRADRPWAQRIARPRGPSRNAVAVQKIRKGERHMSRLAAWLIAVDLSMTAAGVAHAQAVQRFDYLVREDMFRGLAGDTAALERAMALCETRLAENSNNAEALVWHGTGLLFRAGEAVRTGDHDKGVALNRAGLAEMAKAVALRPNDISVLIPRGAVMLAAGVRIPGVQRARPFFENAGGALPKDPGFLPPFSRKPPPPP